MKSRCGAESQLERMVQDFPILDMQLSSTQSRRVSMEFAGVWWTWNWYRNASRAHVLNFGKAGNGPEIIPGFVLAIEPMITRGSARTKVLSDDWTLSQQISHVGHTLNIPMQSCLMATICTNSI